MPIQRRALIVGTGAAIVTASAAGAFIFGNRTEGGTVFTVDGIAIRGTDPVAYFTEGGPVEGSADYAYEWSGATWHFASVENRDMFAADPEAYAPAYGGYCAWAVAENGSLAPTQPENWAIVDDRLFLNFNDDIQGKWNADIPGFIAEGDRRWPDVAAAEG